MNKTKKNTPTTQPTLIDAIQQTKAILRDAPERYSLKSPLEEMADLARKPLEVIGRRLKISIENALLFVGIFYPNQYGKVDFEHISDVLHLDITEVMKRYNDLRELAKKKLIIIKHRGDNDYEFKMTRAIFEGILTDSVNLEEIRTLGEMDFFDLLQAVERLMDEHRDEEQEYQNLHRDIDDLRDSLKHLSEVRWLDTLGLNTEHFAMVCYLARNELANPGGTTPLSTLLKKVYYKLRKIQFSRRMMENGKHTLFTKNLIITAASNLFSADNIKLSPYAAKKLLGLTTAPMRESEFHSRHLLMTAAENVESRKLIFEGNTKAELKELERVVRPTGYSKFSKRMRNLQMSEGLTVLLHGGPGTGKTETVRQLARLSGRNLLMVNISSIRDKFIGESEKRLTQIFDDYRSSLRSFKKHPILLFNEADALISRRMGVSSSADQMNNAMQNILLQELEEFKGILIATTNLKIMLDKAFERRFLLKVGFTEPGPQARYEILASKIPSVASTDLKWVAEQYALTGGQIDNIGRRIEMLHILGKTANGIDRGELKRLCDGEALQMRQEKGVRVGFRRDAA